MEFRNEGMKPNLKKIHIIGSEIFEKMKEFFFLNCYLVMLCKREFLQKQ